MRLLKWQRTWLDAFHEHRHGQYVIVSANGCGKTAMVGPLLVYVAAVLGGQAIYFSASEKQTRTQMKSALERLVNRIEELPDDVEVYNHGVTFPGGGAVILAIALITTVSLVAALILCFTAYSNMPQELGGLRPDHVLIEMHSDPRAFFVLLGACAILVFQSLYYRC